MKLTFEIKADPDGGGFVAHCEELGVASCGETVPEAVSLIGDAVATYIECLQDLGEWPPKRPSFLLRLGAWILEQFEGYGGKSSSQ